MFCYNQASFNIKKNLVVGQKTEFKVSFKTRIELKLNSLKTFFWPSFSWHQEKLGSIKSQRAKL
jgi:hypothetical protein